jgi:hypothetical protein
VWPPRRLTRKQKVYLLIYYILALGGIGTFVVLVLGIIALPL